MNNRIKTLAVCAVTVALTAWVGAQVDVAIRPPAPIPNDPLVSLNQVQAPHGQLVYIVPVAVPGPPTRTPGDLIVVPTGANSVKSVHRLVPPLAEVVFGPQLVPTSDKVTASATTSTLVKVGWPYETLSTYKLYRWNWKTKALEKGPPQSLVFRSVYTSPSGRYVAFITGGDAAGQEWGQPRTQPIALHVYDWQTHKVIDIARKPLLAEATWTPQETLLYTSFDTGAQPQQTDAAGKLVSVPTEATKAVFEFSPQDGSDSLLIPNAYAPMSSPDGKQVAVLGWNLPSERGTDTKTPEQQNADARALLAFSVGAVPAPQLWAYSRATQTKTLLSSKEPTFYRWEPEGKGLILCEQTYLGEKAGQFTNRGTIFRVDANTQAKMEVTQFDTLDQQPTDKNWKKKRFSFMGWDGSSNRFVMSELDLSGENEDGAFLLRTTLSVVDIPKKTSLNFAVFKYTVEDMLGFDWASST